MHQICIWILPNCVHTYMYIYIYIYIYFFFAFTYIIYKYYLMYDVCIYIHYNIFCIKWHTFILPTTHCRSKSYILPLTQLHKRPINDVINILTLARYVSVLVQKSPIRPIQSARIWRTVCQYSSVCSQVFVCHVWQTAGVFTVVCLQTAHPFYRWDLTFRYYKSQWWRNVFNIVAFKQFPYNYLYSI